MIIRLKIEFGVLYDLLWSPFPRNVALRDVNTFWK